MSFQIVGENGTIRLSETGYKIIYEDGKVDTPSPAKPGLPTGWHVEIDYLLNCIVQNTPPVDFLTIEDLIDSLAIIEAEGESIINKTSIEVKYSRQ